ncbi:MULTISPECIES: c-type cytochrome [Nitratiruptor]|uniref:Nitric oxide reductase, NorC subunit apoprotein n=1 Tax=Nitratiruptor tergarcus DSM 16512 TaxID=1069081 RepID=A0A1W1WSB3_9BACT|nr:MULTISPECIES: cytochrome c [Nitratiruptor]SMC08603.1 nitric oxide reductase, NorC subunit apoprotein [Nitratiruptor tergarcus DSM 16512]
MENRPSVWSSNRFWRRSATWVTGVSAVLLIFLTMDSMSQMTMGTAKDIQNKVTKRIPSPVVINYKIDYQLNRKRGHEVPIIGGMDANGNSKYEEKEKFFGRDDYSEKEAQALIHKGKLTIQAKNCMDCHTLLGNGAYYAPDLTKAWLDPTWNTLAAAYGGKEYAIAKFLENPPAMAMHERKMPNLGITPEEAKAVVAYLKFMAAIDTNGFPRNFGKIKGAVDARK